MGIIKCEQGHYYDQQKYEKCPYCKKEKKKEKREAISNRAERYEEGLTVMKPLESVQRPAPKIVPQGFREFDAEKTVGLYSSQKGTKKIVGWLVCSVGKEAGRDYRLYHGFNYIGRDFSMDICFSDDLHISREKHGAIIYDDKKNQFYAMAINGSVTINGQSAANTQIINDGDVILLGESEYIFIPFCKGERIWKKES